MDLKFSEKKRFLQGLVVIKCLILLGAAAYYYDDGYFGDKPSHAGGAEIPAESGGKIPQAKNGVAAGEKVSVTNKAAPSEKKESPENEKKSDEIQATTAEAPKKRRSFLDSLLNLPSLDPDSLKKEEVGKFMSLAERKKHQVDERLVLLKKREAQLQELEKSIDGKISRLEEERLFFAQTIQTEKDLRSKRLEKLIELYSKMEPRKAAPVFEKMDKDLVVEMFKAISQKQMTKILEGMDAQKSVELSEYFGRVRSAKEYDLLKEMNTSLKKEFSDCKGMPKEIAPTATQLSPAATTASQ